MKIKLDDNANIRSIGLYDAESGAYLGTLKDGEVVPCDDIYKDNGEEWQLDELKNELTKALTLTNER